MTFKINCIPFLILFSLANCSGDRETEIPENIASVENLEVFELPEQPLQVIQFNREISYGSTEEVIIGQINGIAVDGQKNVYIADDDHVMIHLFDESGTYIQSIGDEGKGPGEFMGMGNLNINHPYLYAQDYRQQRLNLFDLETKAFRKTIKLQSENQKMDELSGFYPMTYTFMPNSDMLLVGFSQSVSMGNIDEDLKIRYYKMNLEGTYVSEKILEVKSSGFLFERTSNSFMVMPSPFGRKAFLNVSSDGTIYKAWSEDFVIYRYNLSGEHLGAWYYSNFSKAPLTLNEALSQRENNETYHRIVKNMDLPETWPAFDKMLIDDQNRLWVAAVVEDKEVYKWWVLDVDGSPLAAFSWPRSRSIEVIKENNVYVKETDDMGLSTIARYEIKGI